MEAIGNRRLKDKVLDFSKLTGLNLVLINYLNLYCYWFLEPESAPQRFLEGKILEILIVSQGKLNAIIIKVLETLTEF